MPATTLRPLGPAARRVAPVARRGARRVAMAALALVAALPLAACAQTPLTAQPYVASDGVDVRHGDLRGHNLLVLAAEEGAPGTVLGSLQNAGSVELTVQIGTAEAPAEVTLAPGENALLGPDDVEVAIAAVDAPPGALTTLSVVTDAGGSTDLQVPVLDGSIPYYADLVPEA